MKWICLKTNNCSCDVGKWTFSLRSRFNVYELSAMYILWYIFYIERIIFGVHDVMVMSIYVKIHWVNGVENFLFIFTPEKWVERRRDKFSEKFSFTMHKEYQLNVHKHLTLSWKTVMINTVIESVLSTVKAFNCESPSGIIKFAMKNDLER